VPFLAIVPCKRAINVLTFKQVGAIFDEDVFSFANPHLNAGAQLRSELLLLHPTLLPNGGRNLVNDHMPNAPNLFGENESV
jgi:hypothetical protein